MGPFGAIWRRRKLISTLERRSRLREAEGILVQRALAHSGEQSPSHILSCPILGGEIVARPVLSQSLKA